MTNGSKSKLVAWCDRVWLKGKLCGKLRRFSKKENCMPSRGVLTKTLLIVSLLVCIALSATAQDAQAQQFTKSLSIEAKGMTLRYAEGWTLSRAETRPHGTAARSDNRNRNEASAAAVPPAGRARMQINTEPRLDHADALHRLREIAAEYDGSISYLNIGGWPALQRRYSVPLARRGEAADEPIEMATRVTTAIAADDRVIRIETFFPPGANKEVVEEVEAIGRTASFAEAGDAQKTNKEIQTLRASPPLRSSPYVPPHSTVRAAQAPQPPMPPKAFLAKRLRPPAKLRVGRAAAKRSKPASSKPLPLAAEKAVRCPPANKTFRKKSPTPG